MSRDNLSNVKSRITAPPELLEPAVAELLRRIPEAWQAFKPDDLTETQAQALFLLTAAGMVERRERLRLRMANHPLVVEATITATGVRGGVEAMESLVVQLWPDWQEAFHRWQAERGRDLPPFHSERGEPSEWRLTDQGAIARKDLDAGEHDRAIVFDFVLKRGLFDGRLHRNPENGQVFQDKPVRGAGALVRLRKIQGEAVTAATVNVGNWGEGGEAFAKAFAGLAAMIQAQAAPAAPAVPVAAAQAPVAPPAPAAKGRAENLRAWTQADLDKAIRQYKADRAARYKELVYAIKGDKSIGLPPSPLAKKAAQEVYGRNAIAKALGVKSPSMVSKSPAWIAIAAELGFDLRRGRAGGTRRTVKPGKIGFDVALEQKSERPAAAADNAPADAALESAERQVTISLINRLARSGKTAKEKAERERAAEDLYNKLLRGDVTDEQARQTVDMVMGPQELPRVADDLRRSNR